MHVIDVQLDEMLRLVLTVESDQVEHGCPGCGVFAVGHGRRRRVLHDAPCLGRVTVLGLAKGANRVFIQGLRFAVQENAYGRLCYDIMRGGFRKDGSTETIGPWPGGDNTYHDSELTGLS